MGGAGLSIRSHAPTHDLQLFQGRSSRVWKQPSCRYSRRGVGRAIRARHPRASSTSLLARRIAKGGKSGRAIQVGASDRSLLVEKIVSKNMFPVDPKPTDAEIRLVRSWIDAGAHSQQQQAHTNRRARRRADLPDAVRRLPRQTQAVKRAHPDSYKY